MTHPEVLQAVAIVIFGDRWKAPLARDLGVAQRLLGDWLEGRASIPPQVWAALSLAVAARTRQAIEVLQQLEAIEAELTIGSPNQENQIEQDEEPETGPISMRSSKTTSERMQAL